MSASDDVAAPMKAAAVKTASCRIRKFNGWRYRMSAYSDSGESDSFPIIPCELKLGCKFLLRIADGYLHKHLKGKKNVD